MYSFKPNRWIMKVKKMVKEKAWKKMRKNNSFKTDKKYGKFKNIKLEKT